jgi:hypothetical protein
MIPSTKFDKVLDTTTSIATPFEGAERDKRTGIAAGPTSVCCTPIAVACLIGSADAL